MALMGIGWKDCGSASEQRYRTAGPTKETGRKLDLVGFDACFMASTEVAYEIKDLAKYMVGSQEMEDGDGWSYASLFSGKPLKELDLILKMKQNVSPRDFALKVVEHAKVVNEETFAGRMPAPGIGRSSGPDVPSLRLLAAPGSAKLHAY